MARKKQFDPNKALAKAMTVFWRLGYESTSVEALMRGMGIAKQSLYDTFGDKRRLYMMALAYYRDEQNGALRRMFESQQSVKDGFAKLLFWAQR
jgi:TetR/AcrR family transcriptional repressor of nem operon